jgi:hypothetical protein
VTVCGLSTLVEPTPVVAKISLGGIEEFAFNTELYSGKPVAHSEIDVAASIHRSPIRIRNLADFVLDVNAPQKASP